MKLVAIGDPHGDLEKIQKIPLEGADLILLTGDLGKADLGRKMHMDKMERMNKGLPKKECSPEEWKAIYMESYDSALGILKYLSKFAQVYMIYGNAERTD
jgi:predicted phosphodiesterase